MGLLNFTSNSKDIDKGLKWGLIFSNSFIYWECVSANIFMIYLTMWAM